MKRIGWILAMTALVAVSSIAVASQTHAKQHAARTAHVAAVSDKCTNPAQCVGSCPSKAAAATSATAASATHMSGKACSVSDPSKCPAWCRPSGAATTSAMAANAHH